MSRKRSDKDFAEEIQMHIAQETSGSSKTKGCTSRRPQPGRDDHSVMSRKHWNGFMKDDGSHGWSMFDETSPTACGDLRQNPGFGAAAIVMLASRHWCDDCHVQRVKSVVLNPLPYANADRLVRIVHNIGGIEQPYFNDGIIATYAEHAQAFESFGVWSPSGQGVTVTGNGDPEEVRALAVSRGLLTTLGVQPEIGRWFSSRDDSPGSTNTVMIGNGYWRQSTAATEASWGGAS